MGLKHITRNKTWPALNQAQLIYDIMSDYVNITEGENFIKNSLGISVTQIRKYIRTLNLLNFIKEVTIVIILQQICILYLRK